VKVDLDSKGGPKALSAADQVAIVESAVDLMSHQQRVEFLAQMKVFAQQNPHHATALLLQNPQLAQLMLHLQVLFDMVQTADIAQVSAMQQQQSQMPAAAPMPVAPAVEPTLSATQQQQLQYFLSLSAAELSHLPPEVQEQVRILRAAAGMR
jgi:protein gp37